jgi:hypothetical protein
MYSPHRPPPLPPQQPIFAPRNSRFESPPQRARAPFPPSDFGGHAPRPRQDNFRQFSPVRGGRGRAGPRW